MQEKAVIAAFPYRRQLATRFIRSSEAALNFACNRLPWIPLVRNAWAEAPIFLEIVLFNVPPLATETDEEYSSIVDAKVS